MKLHTLLASLVLTACASQPATKPQPSAAAIAAARLECSLTSTYLTQAKEFKDNGIDAETTISELHKKRTKEKIEKIKSFGGDTDSPALQNMLARDESRIRSAVEFAYSEHTNDFVPHCIQQRLGIQR